MNDRRVGAVAPARHVRDGVGVRIRRVAMAGNARFDPFLMLDELGSDNSADYIGGFPEHPHRGFDTVTLMLAGKMRHRDSLGNEGVIGTGDVQWMSAARGVLHSEMPEQRNGELRGFQLWINLPAALKMGDPRYREINAADIPVVAPAAGVSVRVIAGELGDVTGPVREVPTRPLLLDATLASSARMRIPVEKTKTALLYVYEGAVRIPAAGGSRNIRAGELAALEQGDSVQIQGLASDSRVLLMAAEPIGEPVAHYGPFVMNSAEEIQQAIVDFREGRLTTSATATTRSER